MQKETKAVVVVLVVLISVSFSLCPREQVTNKVTERREALGGRGVVGLYKNG